MAQTTATVVRAGFMEKKGSFNSSYKRRWFVLYDNGTMQYFANSDDTNERGHCDFSVIEQMEKTSSITFEVTTGKRVWAFRSENDGDCNEWFDAIQSVAVSDQKSKPRPDRVEFVRLRPHKVISAVLTLCPWNRRWIKLRILTCSTMPRVGIAVMDSTTESVVDWTD